MKRIYIPAAFYNRRTYLGVGIAGVGLFLTAFMMALDMTSKHSKPYTGILAFIVFPALIILGMDLVFWGGYRTQKRIKAGKAEIPLLPKIDLNDPHQRRSVVWFSFGLILFLVVSAFGSYRAYEFSDSDTFCGEVCHEVMEPEYTAYQSSPHARVGCAQCHIGSGADWFVKAKISGAYQVYSVLFNKYARPIATPIENLRPAQQTCEQCHWPSHFYSELRKSNTYFMNDETNSRWNLDLLVKVGGGNSETGQSGGIHWSMNIANDIQYIAADRKRQIITWIQATDRTTGKSRIYRSPDAPATIDNADGHEIRHMDCIDCHNRPSHQFHPPAQSVNSFMSLGRISPSLPEAKALAVKVLDTPYFSSASGLDSIRIQIEEFYRLRLPGMNDGTKQDVERMVEEVQKIYRRNYFPYMRAGWKSYPNNIGHMYSDGCFRCHDGKHKSDDGKVLTKDCNICHTIVAQQLPGKKPMVSLSGMAYEHPVEIGDVLQAMNCADCHNKK